MLMARRNEDDNGFGVDVDEDADVRCWMLMGAAACDLDFLR